MAVVWQTLKHYTAIMNSRGPGGSRADLRVVLIVGGLGKGIDRVLAGKGARGGRHHEYVRMN